jgi:hypothetical protein
MRWKKRQAQAGISRLRQKTHQQKHRFSFTRNAPLAIEFEPMPSEKLEQIVSRKKAVPDRSKISMQNDHEVKYWARHFGVTQKHLLLAIEKVGNSAASVRKELQTRSLGA